MNLKAEKMEWEKVKELYPNLDDFQIAEIVVKLQLDEVIGVDYYKRCRAQSLVLANTDFGIDEKLQDKLLDRIKSI